MVALATENRTDAPALEMRGIEKSFPGVKALRGVDLNVRSGEIHALMGENGAGKSTLMKILAGAYRADKGEVRIEGKLATLGDPAAARRSGITLIYQEISLAPNLTVAENIFLGEELSGPGGLVDRGAMKRAAREALDRLGASFDPGMVAGRLTIAEQQQVEIARALHRKSRVLIMDEPTAALSDRETERLFNLIRQLREDGLAIVYISHRMAEVYALADRVSVLRDGGYVGTLERSELSAERLIQMMVGRPLGDFYKHERHEAGDTVLDIKNFRDARGKVRDVSITLRAGEIVGLAGLVGAGRTELARLIFGADPLAGGQLFLNGQETRVRSPLEAIHAGIGYVPEDRKQQGLFLEMSASENITMNVLDRESASAGVLRPRRLLDLTRQAIKDFAIRVAGPWARAVGLSGGNQQKLLVARWVEIHPKVLLLDEPTRGVDIGAKSEIYRLVGELAAKGVAVLFISSELPEVIGISSRVYVMREGSLTGELRGGDGKQAITQENIMELATGSAQTV